MKGARFFVLGRVGVAIDGEDVPIPGRRERAVLASLLAARGQVVSVDRLILDIWGDAAADSAPASLQVAVSRLRAIVEPGRAPRTESRFLVSSGPGYALVADPETVDAERFAALVEDAHLALEEGERNAPGGSPRKPVRSGPVSPSPKRSTANWSTPRRLASRTCD
jgi:DNA-binding SARP family transcriptional activator